MSLVLYHAAISTCSQKVRLALAEKGLTFTSRPIDVRTREHLSPWYLALNPNGVIPTLVHDEIPIIDSSAICEYLNEVFPEPALAPHDAVGRARMRAWMRYFEESPTAAIRVPSFNKALIRPFQQMSPEQFAAMTARMPLRRHFYQDMGQSGFSQKAYDESIERLSVCMRRIAGALADGRPYLVGEQFTIADIVLTPSVVRMQDLELQQLWEGLPCISDWLARVQARPSFAQAYYPGSRLDLAQWAQGVNVGELGIAGDIA